MITQITGKLIEKLPTQVVIDINGIGYEIEISMQTFYQLPNIGEFIYLYTQLIIREDAHLLFGFIHKTERTSFRHLLKVSGIGAKTALAILSVMNSDELALAVTTEDIKKLSSVPGIGKKTAERMILELRGKLDYVSNLDLNIFKLAPNANDAVTQDIINALLVLGYTEREAKNAIKEINTSNVSEGIRLALKNLSK